MYVKEIPDGSGLASNALNKKMHRLALCSPSGVHRALYMWLVTKPVNTGRIHNKRLLLSHSDT